MLMVRLWVMLIANASFSTAIRISLLDFRMCSVRSVVSVSLFLI